MPRYAPRMTSAALVQKLYEHVMRNEEFAEEGEYDDSMAPEHVIESALYCGGEFDLFTRVTQDWKKIKFYAENLTSRKGGGFGVETMVGPQELDNGFAYIGVFAGGDWESPLYMIVYHDGKEFRGYVPTDGNCFNHKDKAAFGSDESYASIKKQYPQVLQHTDGSDDAMKEWVRAAPLKDLIDEDKIIADIKNRILVR